MDFKLSREDEEFRQEVRHFLNSESTLTKEVRREHAGGQGWGPYTKEFMRKTGAKGYLAPSWPTEYGGLGATHIRKYIVNEEVAYAVGRLGLGGISLAGPAILLFGSEEQKRTFLPPIAKGEIELAIGYTEPQAGSDLANIEMQAVKQGDYYVINGQKAFNTHCHYAEYHWLAVRTNREAKGYKGISMFIVDIKSPGITICPIYGMGKYRTNDVFYDDVKVPANRLVGEENHGWEYVMAALGFERTWLNGECQREFDRLLEYVSGNRPNGKRIADEQTSRRRVAQLAIEIEVARLFGLRLACMVEKGVIPRHEAAIAKVHGSETSYRLADEWMRAIAPYGQLDQGSEYAFDEGLISRWYYHAGVRGLITAGSSEIMRNIIALQMGLPRK